MFLLLHEMSSCSKIGCFFSSHGYDNNFLGFDMAALHQSGSSNRTRSPGLNSIPAFAWRLVMEYTLCHHQLKMTQQLTMTQRQRPPDWSPSSSTSVQGCHCRSTFCNEMRYWTCSCLQCPRRKPNELSLQAWHYSLQCPPVQHRRGRHRQQQDEKWVLLPRPACLRCLQVLDAQPRPQFVRYWSWSLYET